MKYVICTDASSHLCSVCNIQLTLHSKMLGMTKIPLAIKTTTQSTERQGATDDISTKKWMIGIVDKVPHSLANKTIPYLTFHLQWMA